MFFTNRNTNKQWTQNGAFQCKKHGHLDEKKDFHHGILELCWLFRWGPFNSIFFWATSRETQITKITWSQKMEPHFDGRDWVVWNPDLKKYRIHLSQPNGAAGFLPLPPGKYRKIPGKNPADESAVSSKISFCLSALSGGFLKHPSSGEASWSA